MGNLDYVFSEENKTTLIRAVCYGRPKTRKTWWAGKAAEAGFNPIFLDGDNGFHILTNIEKKAQKRISRIACYDKIGRPVFAPFVIKLLKQRTLFWDDTDREQMLGMTGTKADHAYAYLDLSKLTNKDILILDSWTRYCISINLRYANENNIDLTEAAKWEWDGYAYGGMLVDWTMNALSALPCHVIVIGHETVYEKYRGTGKDRTLISTTTVMQTTSNPKAMTITSGFSDVLYFTTVGGNTRIDTKAEAGRIGGCRGIAPGVYDWDKLQFTDICKAYGIQIPGNVEREPDCDAVRYFRPGDVIPEDLFGKAKAPLTPKLIPAVEAGVGLPAKASLAGLLKKG